MSIRDLADAWSSVYSQSASIKSAVQFAHVGGLLAGGGCAVAADRTTLRALRLDQAALERELDHLRGVHRVVIGGLAIVIVSGLLLMFADLDAYLDATVFWVKMALVAALMANGGFVVVAARRVREAHPSGPRRLRTASLASAALWFLVTCLGSVLPNVL